MKKRWVYKDQGDEEITRQLADELSVDLNLSNLLVQRGTHTFDQARSYFRPQIEDLHDPFLMKDMELATDRIQQAIQNEEKILVYGDYDVDGTTAVALVYTFINRFYHNIDFYIPDREEAFIILLRLWTRILCGFMFACGS